MRPPYENIAQVSRKTYFMGHLRRRTKVRSKSNFETQTLYNTCLMCSVVSGFQTRNLFLHRETGEKWAIIRESTLKLRIKLGISVLHKTLALPSKRSNYAGFLAIFSLIS